jgi:hypothetical protein
MLSLDSVRTVREIRVVDEQGTRYPQLRPRGLAWDCRKKRGLYQSRTQDFGRCVDSFRATFEYSFYAQIRVRFSVVSNVNSISVLDNIRTLAHGRLGVFDRISLASAHISVTGTYGTST